MSNIKRATTECDQHSKKNINWSKPGLLKLFNRTTINLDLVKLLTAKFVTAKLKGKALTVLINLRFVVISNLLAGANFAGLMSIT